MKYETYSEYDPRHTTLAESAFLTLWATLGAWHGDLVLVGGLVPKYLCGDLTQHRSLPRPATLDVDLGIALAPDSGQSGSPWWEPRGEGLNRSETQPARREKNSKEFPLSTGVLAEQHHAKLQQLLSSLPPSFIEKLAKRSSCNHQRSQDEGQRVDIEAEEEQEGCIMLLTSSTFKSKVEREKAHERIARGRVLLMVGTHSLLHVPTFFSLGLVCIDEQHK